jgi:tetratricopeptide (TPR) repeat protein
MRLVGELGMDYETRGIMLEGDGSTAGLGNPRAGMEDHLKALTFFEQLAAAYPSDYKKQRKIPMLNLRIGDELVKLGDRREAIQHFRFGLEALLRMPQDPNNRVLQRDLNNAYQALGDALLMEGNTTEAMTNFEKELAYIERVAAADASDTSTLFYLAASYADVGRGAVEAGDIQKGITFLRKAVAGGEHLNTLSQTSWDSTSLAQYDVWLAEALGKSGNTSEETQLYQRALEIYSKIANADAKDIQDSIAVAACHARIGAALLRSGDLNRAGEHYRRALELSTTLAPKLPESLDIRYLVAATNSGLGDVASRYAQSAWTESERSKFWAQAQSWYEQSLAEWTKIPNPSHIAPNEFKVNAPKEVEQRLARCRTELAHARGSSKAM